MAGRRLPPPLLLALLRAGALRPCWRVRAVAGGRLPAMLLGRAEAGAPLQDAQAVDGQRARHEGDEAGDYARG